MTNPNPATASETNDAIVLRRREIAIVWNIEDVLSLYENLSDEQAWQILRSVERDHDPSIGINWDVIACHAEMLIGEAGKPSGSCQTPSDPE